MAIDRRVANEGASCLSVEEGRKNAMKVAKRLQKKLSGKEEEEEDSEEAFENDSTAIRTHTHIHILSGNIFFLFS